MKNFFKKYKNYILTTIVTSLFLSIIYIGSITGTDPSKRIDNINYVLNSKIKDVYLSQNGGQIKVTTKEKDGKHVGYFPSTLFTVSTDNNFLSKLEKANKNVIWIQQNDSPVWGILKTLGIIGIFGVVGYLVYTQLRLMTGMFSGKKPFTIVKPKDILTERKDLIGLDYVNEEIDLIIKQIKLKEETIKRQPGETKEEYKKRVDNAKSFLKKPFNIKLDGPAGTGKTEQAGLIAKTLGYPLIMASASNLESGIVGGGSNMLQDIVKEAKKFDKVVIFLDEAQGLFKKRGQSRGDFVDDTANTFLSILEGVNTNDSTEIIWVVASNFNSETMEQDEAMLRRFPLKIDFRLPSLEERIEIYKHYCSKVSKDKIGEINYNYLATISSGLSPAIIKNIVERATTLAYVNHEKLDTDMLFNAFEIMTIGKMNRETTKGMEKTREIIAIHELGHFFSALSMLVYRDTGSFSIKENISKIDKYLENINTLKISTEAVSRNNALGYVLSKEDLELLKSKKDLEDQIVHMYGGQAAEEVFLGKDNITTGASNDFQKATYFINKMVSESCLYTDSKIVTEIAKNEKQKKELEDIEIKLSRDLYEKALSAVRENKEYIKHYTPILLKEYVLDIEYIKNNIKKV